jgi:hypothetical protein
MSGFACAILGVIPLHPTKNRNAIGHPPAATEKSTLDPFPRHSQIPLYNMLIFISSKISDCGDGLRQIIFDGVEVCNTNLLFLPPPLPVV